MPELSRPRPLSNISAETAQTAATPEDSEQRIAASRGGDPLLAVRGLTSRFYLADRVVYAVEDVSFEVRAGESVGVVGESGSGKTATVMSVLGLLQPPGRIVSGEISFEGANLVGASAETMRSIRGKRMALVPQNPMAALNPLFTIEWQLREALTSHQHVSKKEARARIVEALGFAGIPTPLEQLHKYPHAFSGGMRQRILIAMAMLNQPVLLLADEPTTALDTTMQAKVLELIAEIVDQRQMSVLLITHNIGVVARVCERVIVMLGGRIVEQGPVADVFRSPAHPYTRQLLLEAPRLGMRRPPLPQSGGGHAEGGARSGGCAFRLRCPLVEAKCTDLPSLTTLGTERLVRCWVAQRDAQQPRLTTRSVSTRTAAES